MSGSVGSGVKHGGVEANQTTTAMAITLVVPTESHIQTTIMTIVMEGEDQRGEDTAVLTIGMSMNETTTMEMVAGADEIVEDKIESADTRMMSMTVVSSRKQAEN